MKRKNRECLQLFGQVSDEVSCRINTRKINWIHICDRKHVSAGYTRVISFRNGCFISVPTVSWLEKKRALCQSKSRDTSLERQGDWFSWISALKITQLPLNGCTIWSSPVCFDNLWWFKYILAFYRTSTTKSSTIGRLSEQILWSRLSADHKPRPLLPPSGTFSSYHSQEQST